MGIEKISDNLTILNKLDHDPEINRLLGKYIDEGDPRGEKIWPSNIVTQEGNIFKIDESEFDRQIDKLKAMATEDNDSEGVLEISKIAEKKSEILALIKFRLEEMGCSVE